MAHLERAEREEDLRPAGPTVDEVSVEQVLVLQTGESVDREDRKQVLELPVDVADNRHLAVFRDCALLLGCYVVE